MNDKTFQEAQMGYAIDQARRASEAAEENTKKIKNRVDELEEGIGYCDNCDELDRKLTALINVLEKKGYLNPNELEGDEQSEEDEEE